MVDAALRETGNLRGVQELRYRVIAHAKEKGVTADKLYADALRSVDALLRAGAKLRTDADALFRSASKRYARLKAESEKAVERWEWWTGERYELEPFYAERHRFSRGKRVKEPAAKAARSGLNAYGFDAEGHLRVQHSHGSSGFTETFRTYSRERIESTHYGARRHEPINAALCHLSDGRIVECHTRATQGASIERYTWVANCIERIEIQRTSDAGNELRCFYDAIGELERIDDVSTIDTRFHSTLWQRPKKGLTLKTLIPKIREHFLELLLAELRQHALASPAYAMALVVDNEAYDHLLPPSVALATWEQREAFIARHGGDAVDYLWSPPEWGEEHELHPWDDRMQALVTPANQLLWSQQKYALAYRLAVDLAKELNTLSLPIDRSDDFVVFACELDGIDGVAGVKKSAPKALQKRLAPLLRRPPRAKKKPHA